MRVKDIIEVKNLKEGLFNDVETSEDNKSSKIRNELKRVGKTALNAMGVIGDFASVVGMILPAVGLAGTVITGVSKILSGVGAVGDIAGVVASTGELFNEKEQLSGMEA